ncbi:MAG: hypothetical protein A2W99_00035 [Bacteroidetes bacterium GWF2_33_16]|nr:MAG: hypothetical protein A2X00_02740 [Bacteroidetes bacterium GWE2_32_14]OFY08665.1 MAG: hypothetical protein A2W99_00035 [Bacteroidetes bacterium GWF2_33_16]
MSFINKLFGNTETSSGEKEDKNTFIDPRDGHVYKTVKIGSQIIMAENLAFKTENGCWAYDNVSENISKYGYLYNWETAKNIAPLGWHLPTSEEWEKLHKYLGDDIKKVYNAIKEGGNSNFNALLGGNRSAFGAFYNMELSTYFWSASVYNRNQVWAFYCDSGGQNADLYDDDSSNGFSVRLFKD